MSPPVSGLISPWPLLVSNELTVPKYFMVSSFVGTRLNGALPLGDVKEGGRCGLAPKTVDRDL
jgi:hypothetical protein